MTKASSGVMSVEGMVSVTGVEDLATLLPSASSTCQRRSRTGLCTSPNLVILPVKLNLRLQTQPMDMASPPLLMDPSSSDLPVFFFLFFSILTTSPLFLFPFPFYISFLCGGAGFYFLGGSFDIHVLPFVVFPFWLPQGGSVTCGCVSQISRCSKCGKFSVVHNR